MIIDTHSHLYAEETDVERSHPEIEEVATYQRPTAYAVFPCKT